MMRKKFILQKWLMCDIRSPLPKSTRIVHPLAITIGEKVKFGENCEIFPKVSIGRKNKDIEENIVIGNNVRICSGACILGEVTIGDNVTIGANAVVLSDIPNNEVWAGIPAKCIKREMEK